MGVRERRNKKEEVASLLGISMQLEREGRKQVVMPGSSRCFSDSG